MILAGPVFGRYIGKKIHLEIPDYMEIQEREYDKDLPSFGMITSSILIPLVLILLNTVSSVLLEEGNMVRGILVYLAYSVLQENK